MQNYFTLEAHIYPPDAACPFHMMVLKLPSIAIFVYAATAIGSISLWCSMEFGTRDWDAGA